VLVRSVTGHSVIDIVERIFGRGAVVDAWAMPPDGITLRPGEIRLVALVLDPSPDAAPDGRAGAPPSSSEDQ
jgi:hypothetical protein